MTNAPMPNLPPVKTSAANGWLAGFQKTLSMTPNNSGLFKRAPLYLIFHFTAGSSAKSSTTWLTSKAAKASAHFVIGNGPKDSWQICPLTHIAWHAGRSYYQGVSGLNDYSIGIEVSNWGVLNSAAGGKFTSWTGKTVPESRVLMAPHRLGGVVRPWEMFNPEQIEWLMQVTAMVLDAVPSIKEIIGHDDVSWPRKVDPGPAFPIGSFRKLMGERSDGPDDELYTVRVTSNLNLRGGPGTSFEKIGSLLNGDIVQVIDREPPWFQVIVQTGDDKGRRGYVYETYLTRV